MNEIKVFENKEFGKVRVQEINNEIWFVAKDVCEALDIKNSRQALTRLDEDEKADVILNDGSQNRNMSIVNEYGLYNLVLASRKQEAKQFKRWITHEVLPSIRKTGGYIAGEKEMTEDELIAQALIVVNRKLEEKVKENESLRIDNSKLTVQNQIMQPKAEYFDELVDRNLLLGFRDTAKEFGIKQSDFINFLLDNKYIYRNKANKLMPYAHKNDGLFEVKESVNTKTKWCGPQTMLTPKGRETFRLLYLQCIKGGK